jgi:hypothetical protein
MLGMALVPVTQRNLTRAQFEQLAEERLRRPTYLAMARLLCDRAIERSSP